MLINSSRFMKIFNGKAVLIEALDRYRAIAPIEIDGVVYPVRARTP